MRSKLANPNHCAVSFLSRAATNLCHIMTLYIGNNFCDCNQYKI